MQSLPAFPIYRINWRPSAFVLFTLPMALMLSTYCITASGFSLAVKAALMLLALIYATHAFLQYRKQPGCTLHFDGKIHSMQQKDGLPWPLLQVSWRDWGFVIELKAEMAGKQRTWFWLTAYAMPEELRRLRLLIKAQHQKAAIQPSRLIINPVL